MLSRRKVSLRQDYYVSSRKKMRGGEDWRQQCGVVEATMGRSLPAAPAQSAKAGRQMDAACPTAQHEDSLRYAVSEHNSSLSLRHHRDSGYDRAQDVVDPGERNWRAIRVVLYCSPGDQPDCRG